MGKSESRKLETWQARSLALRKTPDRSRSKGKVGEVQDGEEALTAHTHGEAAPFLVQTAQEVGAAC